MGLGGLWGGGQHVWVWGWFWDGGQGVWDWGGWICGAGVSRVGELCGTLPPIYISPQPASFTLVGGRGLLEPPRLGD